MVEPPFLRRKSYSASYSFYLDYRHSIYFLDILVVHFLPFLYIFDVVGGVSVFRFVEKSHPLAHPRRVLVEIIASFSYCAFFW